MARFKIDAEHAIKVTARQRRALIGSVRASRNLTRRLVSISKWLAPESFLLILRGILAELGNLLIATRQKIKSFIPAPAILAMFVLICLVPTPVGAIKHPLQANKPLVAFTAGAGHSDPKLHINTQPQTAVFQKKHDPRRNDLYEASWEKDGKNFSITFLGELFVPDAPYTDFCFGESLPEAPPAETSFPLISGNFDCYVIKPCHKAHTSIDHDLHRSGRHRRSVTDAVEKMKVKISNIKHTTLGDFYKVITVGNLLAATIVAAVMSFWSPAYGSIAFILVLAGCFGTEATVSSTSALARTGCTTADKLALLQIGHRFNYRLSLHENQCIDIKGSNKPPVRFVASYVDLTKAMVAAYHVYPHAHLGAQLNDYKCPGSYHDLSDPKTEGCDATKCTACHTGNDLQGGHRFRCGCFAIGYVHVSSCVDVIPGTPSIAYDVDPKKVEYIILVEVADPRGLPISTIARVSPTNPVQEVDTEIFGTVRFQFNTGDFGINPASHYLVETPVLSGYNSFRWIPKTEVSPSRFFMGGVGKKVGDNYKQHIKWGKSGCHQFWPVMSTPLKALNSDKFQHASPGTGNTKAISDTISVAVTVDISDLVMDNSTLPNCDSQCMGIKTPKIEYIQHEDSATTDVTITFPSFGFSRCKDSASHTAIKVGSTYYSCKMIMPYVKGCTPRRALAQATGLGGASSDSIVFDYSCSAGETTFHLFGVPYHLNVETKGTWTVMTDFLSHVSAATSSRLVNQPSGLGIFEGLFSGLHFGISSILDALGLGRYLGVLFLVGFVIMCFAIRAPILGVLGMMMTALYTYYTFYRQSSRMSNKKLILFFFLSLLSLCSGASYREKKRSAWGVVLESDLSLHFGSIDKVHFANRYSLAFPDMSWVSCPEGEKKCAFVIDNERDFQEAQEAYWNTSKWLPYMGRVFIEEDYSPQTCPNSNSGEPDYPILIISPGYTGPLGTHNLYLSQMIQEISSTTGHHKSCYLEPFAKLESLCPPLVPSYQHLNLSSSSNGTRSKVEYVADLLTIMDIIPTILKDAPINVMKLAREGGTYRNETSGLFFSLERMGSLYRMISLQHQSSVLSPLSISGYGTPFPSQENHTSWFTPLLRGTMYRINPYLGKKAFWLPISLHAHETLTQDIVRFLRTTHSPVHYKVNIIPSRVRCRLNVSPNTLIEEITTIGSILGMQKCTRGERTTSPSFDLTLESGSKHFHKSYKGFQTGGE